MIDFIDDMFSTGSKHDTSEYLKELYNERAAILEFDAGMSRADAERMARKQIYGDNTREGNC